MSTPTPTPTPTPSGLSGVPTPRQIVEGFSITHAAILDGTTSAVETDLFGVRTANLAPDTGSVDNTGDDAVLSVWSWLNFATLTAQSGFISFPVLSKLTGTPPTGDATKISIPLWQEDAGNQPPYPVLLRMASRDRARHTCYLDILLYSVQFGPMTFDGPAYKTGLSVNFAGKALISDVDEQGNALTGLRRAGDIISTVIA